MNTGRLLLMVSLCIWTADHALAQHSDIELFDDAGQVAAEPRIAEGEFGEAFNPAYRADEPGLVSDPDELLTHGETPLPGGAFVGYELVPFTLNGTTKTLFYWDGTGTPDFVSIAFPHRLKISDPTESFSFQYDNLGLFGGFDFALTADGSGPDPAGLLHSHLKFDLVDSAGLGVDSPTAGVYVFATTFSVAELADSQPIYWVLASGVDESVHETAADYISANAGFLPEPGTLLFAGSSLMLGLLRRTHFLKN